MSNNRNLSSLSQAENMPIGIWQDPFLPNDRLFDNMFSKAFPEFSKTFGIDAIQKASYPKVNILETDDEIRVIAEIAGLTKDEVSITVKETDNYSPFSTNANYGGKVLTISGKKEFEKKDDNVKYIIRELKHSYFERSFVINKSSDYNFDEISAKHENGVLTISIPKMVVKKTENDVKHIKVD